MGTFLMISWPILIFVSYKGAIWALNKAGKL